MSDRLALSESSNGLARWTDARVGLGRVGASATTKSILDFGMDHARARDAIHGALPLDQLALELQHAGFRTRPVTSQAADRAQYLQRPDLGRLLSVESRQTLEQAALPGLLTVIVADGLSALAPARHAIPLLERLRSALSAWTFDEVILVTQARVAIGDEVAAARGSEATIVLIGERPGLRSPDSLGAYLTYRPQPGYSNAQRNCVSNIRPGGLSYDEAACTLGRLLAGARALGVSGVSLKLGSEGVTLPPGAA